MCTTQGKRGYAAIHEAKESVTEAVNPLRRRVNVVQNERARANNMGGGTTTNAHAKQYN